MNEKPDMFKNMAVSVLMGTSSSSPSLPSETIAEEVVLVACRETPAR